tara:strand:+ start:430 stop:660 length:231 start_codon:yes stop_codon:yes gene_type:complete
MKKIYHLVLTLCLFSVIALTSFNSANATDCVSCTEINDDAWCMTDITCQKAIITPETCNKVATNQGYCDDFIPPLP